MSDFKFRTLSITEAEESALVQIIMYFNDMGLPDTIEHKDYETLSDKICELSLIHISEPTRPY